MTAPHSTAAADVSDDSWVLHAVPYGLEQLGGPDVLVNNVGIGAQGSVEGTPLEASVTGSALALDGGMAGLRLLARTATGR